MRGMAVAAVRETPRKPLICSVNKNAFPIGKLLKAAREAASSVSSPRFSTYLFTDFVDIPKTACDFRDLAHNAEVHADVRAGFVAALVSALVLVACAPAPGACRGAESFHLPHRTG